MGEPFIIAEAGVNHNGSLEVALRLVDAAARSGVDAVKFQTFRAETLATQEAPMAGYQKKTVDDGSQFEMLRRLELDEAAHYAIARRCAEQGLEFMSTPFDVPSVSLLSALGVRRFKIPSGELNNPLLLRAIAATGRPMIMSTGMATLGEVEWGLSVVARALRPELGEGAAWSGDGQSTLAERVTILHCTTEYPAPARAANLRAMVTMREAFGLPVGYSDHTLGASVAIAAVALGATVVEKHFTLDPSMPGPDHAASLPAGELPEFVRALRDTHEALGDGRKVPRPEEIANRVVARRSIVAARGIRRGETLTVDALALKRPAHGLPASRWDEVVGRVAARDYAADEPID